MDDLAAATESPAIPDGLTDLLCARTRPQLGPDDQELLTRDAWDLISDQRGHDTLLRVRSVGDTPTTVLDVVMPDQRFVFSTLLDAVLNAGFEPSFEMHPLFCVGRDDERDGAILSCLSPLDGSERLAYIRLAWPGVLDDAAGERLAGRIDDALDGLTEASRLADSMWALLDRAFDDSADSEARALFEWLAADNLVLFAAEADGTRIGIPQVEWPDGALTARGVAASLPQLSRIHRSAPISVVSLGPGIAAVGVVTRAGTHTSPVAVPVLRRQVQRCLKRAGVVPGSADAAEAVRLLSRLPLELIWALDDEQLTDLISQALLANATVNPLALVLRSGASAGRDDVVDVVIGRAADELDRETVIDAAEHAQIRAHAEETSVHLSITADALSLATITLLRPEPQLIDEAADLVAALLRGWQDAVGGVSADLIASTSQRYRVVTPPDAAAGDLSIFGDLPPGSARAWWYDDSPDPQLRIVTRARTVPLSRLVPQLAHLGLEVIDETATAITTHAEADRAGSVLALRVRYAAATEQADDSAIRPIRAEVGERIVAALHAAWSGATDIDEYSPLICSTELDWEDVALLRALGRYLAQIGAYGTAASIAEALNAAPRAGRMLVGLVAAVTGDPYAAPPLVAELETVARELDRLDHDRAIRALAALAQAVKATNHWHRNGAESVFSFDAARIPSGDARLWQETWVCGPTVEGIHLRCGPVARGGLRWSDRTADFRTEVQQLVRAQQLKNAVIVPTGAKGGFVLRRRRQIPAGALGDAVREAYTRYVQGLLSVVDVEHDYVVVAADRGTATFSDLANSIATEAGLWLGDAFASGGSSGYDHKALGVTARGAWESIKHHFASVGTDAVAESISVAAVGDMSGDVFGNGMLYTPNLRLVAAFDHRHVFIDPTPDAPTAYAERRRLFELSRSSWDDYDRAVLSDGAMIVPRSAKTVDLTEEVAHALGAADLPRTVTPDELVRMVLCAPVDLLYFGGIGTYLRGADETDEAVGDRANDSVRVPASEVRASVVAEGANLGVTPTARVELATRGIRVNSDAIDNSAGVDTSDLEVNLKILFDPRRDDLLERDRLLESVSDTVVETVLRHVANQNRALTQQQLDSAAGIAPFAHIIDHLEADGWIDRTADALPDNRTILARGRDGQGLHRPELAVLMAAVKNVLADAMAAHELGDQEPFLALLDGYFPDALSSSRPDAVRHHRLRHQIVANRLANESVDRMGICWAHELADRHNVDVSNVLVAYWMARSSVGVGAWWEAIDRTAPGDAATIWRPVRALVDALANDVLRRGVAQRNDWAALEPIKDAAAALAAELIDDSNVITDLSAPAKDPAVLAAQAAALNRLSWAPAVAQVAARRSTSANAVVTPMLRVSRAFGLDRLTDALAAIPIPPGDTWAARHRESLNHDLDRLRRSVTAAALERFADREHPEDALVELAGGQMNAARRTIESSLDPSNDRLDAAAVAVSQLWQVIESMGKVDS